MACGPASGTKTTCRSRLGRLLPEQGRRFLDPPGWKRHDFPALRAEPIEPLAHPRKHHVHIVTALLRVLHTGAMDFIDDLVRFRCSEFHEFGRYANNRAGVVL